MLPLLREFFFRFFSELLPIWKQDWWQKKDNKKELVRLTVKVSLTKRTKGGPFFLFSSHFSWTIAVTKDSRG